MDIEIIKAAIFDCDGVMFDTALANRKYYNEVLHKFNKPGLTDEQFFNVHMMTIKTAVEYLFPETNDYFNVYTCMKKIGYKKFIKYMVVEEGFEQLLKTLKKCDYIIGIATNRTDTMEKILKDFHLEEYFDIVMTAAKVQNPKPDPEQLLNIMNKLQLNPDEVVFIGDSQYDQIAAQAAKVNFISFKNPKLIADYHVDSMNEIATILQIPAMRQT